MTKPLQDTTASKPPAITEETTLDPREDRREVTARVQEFNDTLWLQTRDCCGDNRESVLLTKRQAEHVYRIIGKWLGLETPKPEPLDQWWARTLLNSGIRQTPEQLAELCRIAYPASPEEGEP